MSLEAALKANTEAILALTHALAAANHRVSNTPATPPADAPKVVDVKPDPKPDPAAETKTDAPKLAYADVKASIDTVMKQGLLTRDAAIALVEEHGGAKRLPEVAEDKWPAVKAAFDALLNKAA